MIFDIESPVDVISTLKIIKGRWATVTTTETAYRGIIYRTVLGDPSYLTLVDIDHEIIEDIPFDDIINLKMIN